jgi:MCP family monocarboxylic acid transporter-like MFS transporter 10
MSYYNETFLFDTNLPLLNLIGSTGSAVVLLLSFVVGRLLDAGYFRYLTAAGWLMESLAMFTLSQATKLRQTVHGIHLVGDFAPIWATHGLVLGLAMAFLFVSSSQIAATWFKKRKSFAIGVVACGASVGMSTVINSYLIHKPFLTVHPKAVLSFLS